MKIIIDISDWALGDMTHEEFKANERKIITLLMDSLAEFKSHRGPNPTEYVNRRYPDTPEYGWLNRTEKVKEVQSRLQLASILHNQAANLRIVWD